MVVIKADEGPENAQAGWWATMNERLGDANSQERSIQVCWRSHRGQGTEGSERSPLHFCFGTRSCGTLSSSAPFREPLSFFPLGVVELVGN